MKKKLPNKQKMTSEEYKLQETAMKKRSKKKGEPEKDDQEEASLPAEKKQPLMIIKMVMKGTLCLGAANY